MTAGSAVGDERVDEVRAWIAATWDPARPLGEWWRLLADAGYAFPTWPEGLGGRGWPAADGRMVERELAAAGAIGAPAGVGQTMGGPTVVAHGTAEQQARFVPLLAAGAECWCQLFSEPGAGSDLAGLRTRAVRDGDRWIVNGQKVWNSDAHRADRGLLLARTDVDVPKHGGISYFVVDMQQPGIEARPLRQMNGSAEFDEVFLADAVVEADRMIGAPGEGWRVAQTTLAFERAGIGSRTSAVAFPAGARDGLLDVPVGELLGRARSTKRGRIGGFMISPRVLADLAREHGVADDPVVRDRLAWCYTKVETMRFLGYRILTQYLRDGELGPVASISKLYWSEYHQVAVDLALAIMGADALVREGRHPFRHFRTDEPGAPNSSNSWIDVFLLNARSGTVYAGTSQVQRNIISETILGLPKEPRG